MSKLKTPHEKKTASLKHDHRNAYGESSKATRKNIPKAKARTKRAYRHEVGQVLHVYGVTPEEGVVDKLETKLANAREQIRLGFKKIPDVPLAEHLSKRKETREKRVGRAIARRASASQRRK